MKKLILISAFLLLVAAQWLVPSKMIYDSEQTLREGVEFKFKTAPVDPSDPFRGKYITLHFEANQWTADTLTKYYQDQTIYVSVINDTAGYAMVNGIYPERPPELATTLIKAYVSYAWLNDDHQDISIRYPFERFYLEESKSSEAERLYWESQNDSTVVVYTVVKVKNDQAVLKDVMINDKSIIEVVREMNQSAK